MKITAKEYLKKKGLKNPPINSGISGGGDIPPVRPSDMMEEWSNLNGKFRDKALFVAERRIAELEEYKDQHVKPLLEALEEINEILCDVRISSQPKIYNIIRIVQQALKTAQQDV